MLMLLLCGRMIVALDSMSDTILRFKRRVGCNACTARRQRSAMAEEIEALIVVGEIGIPDEQEPQDLGQM